MKHESPFLILLLGLSFLLLSACTSRIAPTQEPDTGMPNPASLHCEQQGYRVEIRTAEDGSQSAVCIFPEGECDEWAYFRGECSPPAEDGESAEPDAINQVADIARRMLGEQLGISPDEILFATFEEVKWPDACLGLPARDEACAEVVTSGYRITLKAGEDTYDFRTDLTGAIVRQEPAAP